MITTETDENYLKEIFMIEREEERATTTQLAQRLGHSAATVTGQLKKLAGLDLVAYSPYHGAELTDQGRSVALATIRHHRLVETYLERALGVPWERVHGEAERLEHVISDYLVDRMDETLGYPTVDPHGSPIPSRAGTLRDNGRRRLSDLEKGQSAQIVEVSDRDSRLLEHLAELGLRPGVVVTVASTEPIDGLITLETATGRLTIGQVSAGQLTIKTTDSCESSHEEGTPHE